jgi:hypothetical protein
MISSGTNLVLDTTSLHLVGEHLGTSLLGLRFVDVLHQDTLVLEHVTLGFLVKGVVTDGQTTSRLSEEDRLTSNSQVSVDLACLSVLA